MYFLRSVLSLFILFSLNAPAQHQAGSSDLLNEIKKLQNSTTVLYLAAHPDDENTRMISWLVNEVGARTAYLSLTRGDGGQNLIGTELGGELGVLRTQELMQARAIDGGEQFFTRAVDFGYSKSSKETLEKWGKEEILADVVWTIRKFRPDIIITRFPPDSRGGHGHHTASAMLALEAFDKAADAEAYSSQLKFLDTWQPKRIYWNASVWWNPKLDSIAKTDDNYLSVNVGGYNPLKGVSSNELASLSRTQHKSQGFGVSVGRGAEKEYLQYLKGDKALENVFEGIPAGWERFGFKAGDQLIKKIIANYDISAPQKSVTALLELKKQVTAINDPLKQKYFSRKLDKIIFRALGIHAEAMAPREYYAPNAEIGVKLEVLTRGHKHVRWPVMLQSVKVNGGNVLPKPVNLVNNKFHTLEFTMEAPSANTAPYWLQSEYENNFSVKDQRLIGKPENDVDIPVELTFLIMNTECSMVLPAIYKYSDRVEGEIIHKVAVIPPVTVNAGLQNMIFTKEKAQTLELDFNFIKATKAQVNLKAEGWTIEPSSFQLEPGKDLKKQVKQITITPIAGSGTQTLEITINGKQAYQRSEIDYNHIDKRIVLSKVSLKLVKIDLRKKGLAVGYIPGAGDKVPEAILQMGYEVEVLDEEKLKTYDLTNYKAIVAGIRAYNTEKWLPGVKNILDSYIENGGNYIVQYNTRSRDLLTLAIGPYPFQISRERVTEEDAKVAFLLPDHPVLNKPNVITPLDFENWVQERGLYFASSWDDNFSAPLGWNDEGEPSRQGGLLVANYGKGAFIYTGISFFRELPAGVPGAYRLLANLISYTNPVKNEQ